MSETRNIPGEGGELMETTIGLTPFAELSRLMMLAITSSGHQIVWTAQTMPNGPWSGAFSPVTTTAYGVLGTGSTVDGRVAMVAQTSASPTAIHYIDEALEQGTDGEERWNAAVDLGMPSGVAVFEQLVMGRDPSGRVQVFGVDANAGAVWWCYQNPLQVVEKTEWVTPPGTSEPIEVTVQTYEPPATPWSSWIELSSDDDIARISLVNDASGRVMLMAIGRNPTITPVYVNAQTSLQALTPADWSGWARVDDATSGTAHSIPTGVLDTAGAVNIFMVGSQNEVVQLRQALPDQPGWSEWTRPGMTGAPLVNVTSGFDGDGLIMLVAVDENLGVWANLQTAVPTQRWNGWQKIATATGIGLAAMDYNSDGRLSYFLADSGAGSVSMISQTALNSTTWGAGFKQLAASGIVTYGIVRDLTPPRS